MASLSKNMLREYLEKKTDSLDLDAPVGTPNNPSFKIFTIANCLSFSRIILTIVFFVLFVSHSNRWICLTIYAAAALTDFFDGQIARRTQTVSWVGKLLDPAVDRLLIFTGVLGLVLVGELPLWIFLTILARDVILGFGMLYVRRYRERPLDVLYIGKVATAFLLLGFSWMLLGIPTISGFGLISVSWLPLLNNTPACVGIMCVYIGVIFSIAAGISYIAEGVHVIKNAKTNNIVNFHEN